MECCLPLYLNTEGIRKIEKGGRVRLSPTVSEYMDIKTDKKEPEQGGNVGMDCCLPPYLNTEILNREINKRDRKGWESGTVSLCI
jgi:hypothetical protein